MAYCTVADVRRQLKRVAGSITISPRAASYGSPGSMFTLNECGSFIAGADAEIDGYCFRRYADQIPFTPVPGEVKWLSERLATADIIHVGLQYSPDVTTEFLYDKQLFLRRAAYEKLVRIADGTDNIRGKKIEEPVRSGEIASESVFDDIGGAVREA